MGRDRVETEFDKTRVLVVYASDDVELHEKGVNRVGNIFINNESYLEFENYIGEVLEKL